MRRAIAAALMVAGALALVDAALTVALQEPLRPRARLGAVVVRGTRPDDLKRAPGPLDANALPGERGTALIRAPDDVRRAVVTA